MRTPANSTKHFVIASPTQMNQLVGAMNTFFTKITKNQIQFQLSEHYALSKKGQNSGKTKNIKKADKLKAQLSAQKLKQLKKAYKKFREELISNNQFIEQNKDLSEKQVNKKAKGQWNKLSVEQQMKWRASVQKKQYALNKKKTQAKTLQKQNGHIKHQKSKDNQNDE